MFANPKTNTILWTAIASIIAWLTVWVYACTISLMARKLIIKGAKISTIESENIPSALRNGWTDMLGCKRLGEAFKSGYNVRQAPPLVVAVYRTFGTGDGCPHSGFCGSVDPDIADQDEPAIWDRT